MSKSAGVVLRLNGDVLRFKTKDELKDYLQSICHGWEWLINMTGAYQEVGKAIFRVYFYDPITAIRQEMEDGRISVYKLGSETSVFLLNDSDAGFLIAKTRREYDDVTAALAILYLSKYTRSLIARDERISEFASSDRLTFERSVAIQIAISLQGFSSIGADARSALMMETLDRFVSHADLATDAVNTYVTDISESTQSAKRDLDSLGDSLKNAYIRRRKRYSAYLLSARNSARAAFTDAVDSFESAKTAYHDQVDLDASVQYWTARKRNHSAFKVIWFFAVLMSMAVMFVSVMGYYGVGGAAGLSNAFGQHRQQSTDGNSAPAGLVAALLPTVASAEPGAPAEHPANTAPADTASSVITTSTPTGGPGAARSEVATAIADLAGVALLITLLGILIRITLRQFNTHSHLALEAEERITFTKTYLALLNEGKLKSEEDRKLVLESLFRSTKSGTMDEIPFSSPVELIFKTISDKKAS